MYTYITLNKCVSTNKCLGRKIIIIMRHVSYVVLCFSIYLQNYDHVKSSLSLVYICSTCEPSLLCLSVRALLEITSFCLRTLCVSNLVVASKATLLVRNLNRHPFALSGVLLFFSGANFILCLSLVLLHF